MIDQFIKQTISFLKRTDTRLHFPEVRKVTFEDDSPTHHLSITDTVYMNSASISNNILLESMIFFSLLDAKIDELHPELESQSFRSRCMSLPRNDDDEIITRELFRILKVLRNATVHSKSSIELINGGIKCSYLNRGTQFELEITRLGLELIYSLIFEILSSKYKKDAYHMGIRRSYYDAIQNELKKFQDDIDDNMALNNLSNGLRLKRIVRYRITDSKYCISNSHLTITRPYVIEEFVRLHYGCDYDLSFDGKNYLVPEECLNTEHSIEISQLSEWEVK